MPSNTGDAKSSEGKERYPIQRSKGSLGSLNMITGKSSYEMDKTSGAADGVFSHRYDNLDSFLLLVWVMVLYFHQLVLPFFLVLHIATSDLVSVISSGDSGSEDSSEGTDANSHSVSHSSFCNYY